ncbi:hypothetical protein BT63DRAFT_407652 [Microthyrium microscopicum]|uniref:Uncharacterized protein n=1 Tax=Microthyrium microscopicum TaxID=703497 RepID=A0A6A6TXS2_9PEZI|nr:hypothetical protein BT63DRAFT_407652 [Microthyrium microscopicum]
MSAESGAGFRPSSPASSGRHSPVLRVSRQHPQDGVNPKDKAYRRYANAIERALASFEGAQQEKWADYIAFLARLLKALQARPPDLHTVPDSFTISTRLAQGLNPTLPPGVHRKALDVYSYIFASLGQANLEKELHLYLPGLTSVLSFASLAVRPEFYKLLEKHFLHLSPSALRAPLKAIILCILPGLEDESSDDHEKWIQLINKFRIAARRNVEDDLAGDSSQDSYFWQSYFLACITNPSRRQGALSYLVRELPKFGDASSPAEDEIGLGSLSAAARAALSPEPGLLVRCLAAGLSDSQILVQRGFLDILVTHLPLNSFVIQKTVPQADLDRLVFAATGVVGRRDMSLNRRLWTWLLGPDAKEDPDPETPITPSLRSVDVESSRHAAYFAKYGLRALTRGMKTMFNSKSTYAAERAKPFRLCLSLMDRWEVGGLLIPDILIPAVKSALDFSQSAEKSAADEVIKSASNFFDGVESSLIWAKFNKLVDDAFSMPHSGSHLGQNNAIDLCTFIVFRFNIREEEMILQHIPYSALYLLGQLRNCLATSSIRGNEYVITEALEIVEKLLSLVPSRAFSTTEKTRDDHRKPDLSIQGMEIIKRINRYYDEQQGSLEGLTTPFLKIDLGLYVLREAVGLLLDLFPHSTAISTTEVLTKTICGLVLKVPDANAFLHQQSILNSFKSILDQNSSGKQTPIGFRVVASITAILVTIQSTSKTKFSYNRHEILTMQNVLAEHLWGHLNPFNSKHHVEAVRCIWQLESIDPRSKLVEAAISTILSKKMLEEKSKVSADAARRFAILWTHSTLEKSSTTDKGPKGSIRRSSSTVSSLGQFLVPTDPSNVLTRPLFLLLDRLEEEGTEVSAFVKNWLQEMPALSRVFLILTDSLRMLLNNKVVANSDEETGALENSNPNLPQAVYYFRQLLRIINNASENTWLTLAGEFVVPLESSPEKDVSITLQVLLVQLSMKALQASVESESCKLKDLRRLSLELAMTLLSGPYAVPLTALNLDTHLLQLLYSTIETADAFEQPLLLQTIVAALKIQYSPSAAALLSPTHARKASKDFFAPLPKSTGTHEVSKLRTESASSKSQRLVIDCLKAGFQSRSSRINIESWVLFLIEVLPIFSDTIFQNLIPLVECLCSQITLIFNQMKSTYQSVEANSQTSPEPTLIGLLNGLEHILASAHDRLLGDEGKTPHPKSPDQPQGFFGNMVQGVFAADAEKPSRSAVANSRLTVLLCFQDAVRTCFSIWCWGTGAEDKQDISSLASYSYTSLRMRNRARRLLEHLFAAETLECMETLAMLWARSSVHNFQQSSVLGIMNVLNGSKPKLTIPAIFNAIYSRTNPNALDPAKQSSLTCELRDQDLIAFLIDYTKTVDDDAMDEIWNDCAAFLRDVLANPLPHSQILPSLLIFAALLAEKVENTNFGEQRRMRKELGDLFSRLLTATFTTRPMGFLQEPSQTSSKKGQANGSRVSRSVDVLAALAAVLPQLKLVLGENDRVLSAVNSITANVTGPTLRGRGFPANMNDNFLSVLQHLTKIPNAAKLWKKDVLDALNDARFFAMPMQLIKDSWLPILQSFAQSDKDRMPELLSRLTAPTTAGIVFGVGATSARNEADRRAQLNLRRVALLLLACPVDTFAQNISSILEKIGELLDATSTSSPSAATRADLFMLIRALFLRMSPIHLAPLWPIVNSELQTSLSSVLPENPDYEKYSNASVIQACKVLDTLTTLDLDDFQLHEWLYITDSIDAVYRPEHFTPVALVDSLAENIAAITAEPDAGDMLATPQNIISTATGQKRRLVMNSLLNSATMDVADLRAMQKEDLAVRILRPFFGQLSILSFEATYGMIAPDVEDCVDGLIKDLFEDGGDSLG